MWKKWLRISLWIVLGLGTGTILIAAMEKKDEKVCADIKINIHGANNHVFVEKTDVVKVLKNAGAVKGAATVSVNLGKVEMSLQKNPWIKDAQLFFDNRQVLHVSIEEREPLARVFTLQGSSFYIDSSCKRLPLSDKMSARVPMFTSFPSDKNKLSHPDSLVLFDIKAIAQFIQQDSMLFSQVAQVDITPQRTYEIIPVVGNQLIKIGNAENLDEKFSKLKMFYKQVWSKVGFEKYETIDVQYTGQVVAVKRGVAKTYMDTLQAIRTYTDAQQQMRLAMYDSSYTMVMSKPQPQQFFVKDTVVQNVKPAAVKNTKAATQKKATAVKPAAKKPNKQAKAVMKKH